MQINEQDILNLEPMTPAENPELDVTIEIPFSKLYDMIYFSEKEMRGAETESPPWDRRPRSGVIKGMLDGARMALKMRSLINSAKVYPESAEKDAKKLFKAFMNIMGRAGEQRGPRGSEEGKEGEFGPEGEGPSEWESKEEITGEIIKDTIW